MAVITPDGIVGKVLAAYPTASHVLLITDPTFAAGVISQKNHVHGTLKGQGHGKLQSWTTCRTRRRSRSGEWFYTSGDDRIFPKGLPVGPGHRGAARQAVQGDLRDPSGLAERCRRSADRAGGRASGDSGGSSRRPTHVSGAARAGRSRRSTAAPAGGPRTALTTDADRFASNTRRSAMRRAHVWRQAAGSKPPDFNLAARPAEKPAPAPKPQAGGTPLPPASQPKLLRPPSRAYTMSDIPPTDVLLHSQRETQIPVSKPGCCSWCRWPPSCFRCMSRCSSSSWHTWNCRCWSPCISR